MRRLALILAFVLAAPLWAGQMVSEAPQEARVRAVAVQLRCPVCQSENILDSHSGTAREMLDLVREQVAAGQSDAQIKEFFRSRYGAYVLLSPPPKGTGALIWALPVLLVIAGVGLGGLLVRRMRRDAGDPPTGDIVLSETRLEELEP